MSKTREAATTAAAAAAVVNRCDITATQSRIIFLRIRTSIVHKAKVYNGCYSYVYDDDDADVAIIVGAMLAIDRPLDMMRTMVNIFSDSIGASVIAKSEGENLYQN